MTKKNIKSIPFFILILIFLIYQSVFARDWSRYTRDGIWYVNKNGKEMKCGRMGKDDPEKRYKTTDYKVATECWDHRCDWGMCQGEVPLCCYKMEETGDPYICPWPERGYCHPKQCEKLSSTQMCAHGIKYWCNHDCQIDENKIPYVAFEQRFSNISQPQPTPTQPILPPTPTSTPTPTQPILPPTPTLTPTFFPKEIKITLPSFPYANPNFTPTTLSPTPESLTLTPLPVSSIFPSFSLPKVNILTPQFKFQLKHTLLSSQKILNLPKAVINDLINLDKRMEETINNALQKLLLLF